MNKAAQQLGRLGGKSKSAAKAAAARANGRRGGRPSAVQVAALFDTPVGEVKEAYAKKAVRFREYAEKAGIGKFQGRSAAQWNLAANYCDQQAV